MYWLYSLELCIAISVYQPLLLFLKDCHFNSQRMPVMYTPSFIVVVTCHKSGSSILDFFKLFLKVYTRSSSIPQPRSCPGVGLKVYTRSSSIPQPRSCPGVGLKVYTRSSSIPQPRSCPGVGLKVYTRSSSIPQPQSCPEVGLKVKIRTPLLSLLLLFFHLNLYNWDLSHPHSIYFHIIRWRSARSLK